VITHTPQRFYQPELDGLRFYAFLGVFAYHTLPEQPAFYRSLRIPLSSLWAAVAKSGASGVDLFFALSAFLITSLLLREQQQTGGLSLRLFYVRRILSIWPLYFAVLAVAVVLAHTIQVKTSPGTTWSATCCLSVTRSMQSSVIQRPSVGFCGRSRSRSNSTWRGLCS
jgi:peptidoglycan/LPS O-acetylase OafA/YrhL